MILCLPFWYSAGLTDGWADGHTSNTTTACYSMTKTALSVRCGRPCVWNKVLVVFTALA